MSLRAEAIFGPVTALALWTGVMLLVTGYRRIRAIKQGRVRVSAFKLGETADLPPDIAVANRNLMNLLEMPVLFYVVCLALYVTRQVGVPVLWLAWGYVGLRIIHSLIHVSTNNVVHRLGPFAASNLVLLALWLTFAVRVFQRS